MDRHGRPGPVDLDRTPGLALHPRGDAQTQHVIGVQLAEPVVAHERNPFTRHESAYSACSSFNVTPTRPNSLCTRAQSGCS